MKEFFKALGIRTFSKEDELIEKSREEHTESMKNINSALSELENIQDRMVSRQENSEVLLGQLRRNINSMQDIAEALGEIKRG